MEQTKIFEVMKQTQKGQEDEAQTKREKMEEYEKNVFEKWLSRVSKRKEIIH